jgi:hypothetical protein
LGAIQQIENLFDNPLCFDAYGLPINSPVHFFSIGEEQDSVLNLASSGHFHEIAFSNSLHFGVAGVFNFDWVGQTRQKYMILADINNTQQEFWHAFFDLISENPVITPAHLTTWIESLNFEARNAGFCFRKEQQDQSIPDLVASLYNNPFCFLRTYALSEE